MKANHVWVIEMKVNGKWLPCDACRLTKRWATLRIKGAWMMADTEDKFRVTKYVAVERVK